MNYKIRIWLLVDLELLLATDFSRTAKGEVFHDIGARNVALKHLLWPLRVSMLFYQRM